MENEIKQVEVSRETMLELERLAEESGLRNYAKLGTELGVSSYIILLIDSKADINTVLRDDGIVQLSADWDIGDGRMIKADKIRARDGDGLSLFEDGGTGIFVKDGGNVGIGTMTPDSKLDIESVNAEMRFTSTSGRTFRVGEVHTGGVFSIYDTVSNLGGVPTFNVAGTVANVGINTVNPLAKLAINGGLAVGEDADPGDNNLKVVGNTEIDGALNHDGTTVGFFGTVPAVQQTGIAALKVNYTAGDLDTEAEIITALNTTNTAINVLRTALNALGLTTVI